MEISTLPVDYLKWLIANFEPGDIRNEAVKVLKSGAVAEEQRARSLEEQANEILGERPVGNLKRGFRRKGHRRK
jgi:hypothetical protein